MILAWFRFLWKWRLRIITFIEYETLDSQAPFSAFSFFSVEQNHILEFGGRKDSTVYIFLLNLQLAFFATGETETMEELTWVKSPSIFIECFVQERHLVYLASVDFMMINGRIQECLLLQDYGIQFDDNYHPFKAFKCKCGSMRCLDKNRKEHIMKISESNMYVMVA